ncbi:MAG TPA: hypothetical protein VMT29_13015 [Steroidobacteraceae bacterium]|nr:hypothetical protein [Steroidobacteraceae bacterium]
MKEFAYPAAVSCGCLLGHAAPAWGAQWTLTPLFSSSVDYDSNRRLELDQSGSESAVVTADLSFRRAVEDGDIYIEPRYSFRRFSDGSLGNGDDRSLYAGFDWLQERTTLNVTASVWDQSTLLTELQETGIVNGNTHRRLAHGSASWTWTQTERRQLITQIALDDVKYHGQNESLLPGYRYPSGSLGERFNFSERGSVTVSLFGSKLESDSPGNSSHEYGVQAQLTYSFTERVHLDGSIGQSSRVLAGTSSHGTDTSITLTRDLERGILSASFTRSLVPYGVGFLVEREQLNALASHSLTTNLDASIAVTRIRNNELAVLLGIDRRSYDSVTANLSWRLTPTWSLSGQVAAVRSQQPGLADQTVHQWRTAVTLIWAPLPRQRSW